MWCFFQFGDSLNLTKDADIHLPHLRAISFKVAHILEIADHLFLIELCAIVSSPAVRRSPIFLWKDSSGSILSSQHMLYSWLQKHEQHRSPCTDFFCPLYITAKIALTILLPEDSQEVPIAWYYCLIFPWLIPYLIHLWYQLLLNHLWSPELIPEHSK